MQGPLDSPLVEKLCKSQPLGPAVPWGLSSGHHQRPETSVCQGTYRETRGFQLQCQGPVWAGLL